MTASVISENCGKMVSPAEQLSQQKQQRTAALRKEYMKAVTNPHRHASAEGGVIVSSRIISFLLLRLLGDLQRFINCLFIVSV